MPFTRLSVKAEILEKRGHTVVMVGARPVLIVKYNGNFYAMEARCPHMGCGVLSDVRDGHIAVCPLHGAEFDVLTGQMVKQPFVLPDRPCEFEKDARPPLRTFPVRVNSDGLIEIDLGQ